MTVVPEAAQYSVPVGQQSVLQQVAQSHLPISDALVTPRLLDSIRAAPAAALVAHGIGAFSDHSA